MSFMLTFLKSPFFGEIKVGFKYISHLPSIRKPVSGRITTWILIVLQQPGL